MAFTQITGGILIDGAASTNLFRLLALKNALKFEVATGMQVTRGRSAYTIVKSEFGFKGSKAKVLAQLEVLVDTVQANAGAQEAQ